MQYNQPFGAQPNASFINGNPAAGIQGSIPPANAIEFPQREIINTILAAGLVPSNNDLTQLLQSIIALSRIPYVIDEGEPNSIVLTPVVPVTAYVPPMVYLVKWAFANTGSAVVSFNGLPTKPLVRPNGSQLLPGDIGPPGGGIIFFDGLQFELVSAPQSPGSQPFIIYSGTDVSTTVNQITISLDASVTAYRTPMWIAITPNTTNTSGTVQVNANAIGNILATRGHGNPLLAGDIQIGAQALFFCDGVELQLMNPQQGFSAPASGGYPPDWNDITGQLDPYWFTTKSAVTGSPPSLPTIGDAYIIPVGASGAWAGLAGKVAQCIGTGPTVWVYRAYPNGALLSVADQQRFYENNGGVWSEVQVPSLGRLMFCAG